MKNDIFNFRRFGRYFASDIKTCTANYGLSLITLSVLALLGLYFVHILFFVLVDQLWNGPGIGLRGFTFALVLICTLVTMPVKCYGKLTDKQYGSFWLMIPASKFEKFLSMIIMTILTPVIGAVIFLTADSLLCALDSTCGTSVFRGMTNFAATMNGLVSEDVVFTESAATIKFIDQLKNPWLYIDDFIGIILPFLLGALFFKSGKTAKTFVAIIAFSIISSIILTPLTMEWGKSLIDIQLSSEPTMQDVESILNNSFFKNVSIYDTISDTLVNLAMLTAIYFRIKTLKH